MLKRCGKNINSIPMFEVELSYYDCIPVKNDIEWHAVFTQIRDGRKLPFILLHVIEDYLFVQLYCGTQCE